MNKQEADSIVKGLATKLGGYRPVNDDSMPEKTLSQVEEYPFDAVAGDFTDNILSRQVPHYETVYRELSAVTAHLIKQAYASRLNDEDIDMNDDANEVRVVQYGCSDGVDLFGPLAELTHRHGAAMTYDDALEVTKFVGIDTSAEMISVAQQKAQIIQEALKGCENPITLLSGFDFHSEDAGAAAKRERSQGTDIALCMLLLQFIPIYERVELLADIYRSLRPGGSLLITEKLLTPNLGFDRMFTELYHEEKRRAGMSEASIENKAKSLPSYLNPLSFTAYKELLVAAGFPAQNIEIVTKTYHFTTFVAQK